MFVSSPVAYVGIGVHGAENIQEGESGPPELKSLLSTSVTLSYS